MSSNESNYSSSSRGRTTIATVGSSSPRTFHIGDLVWGAVRGSPAWPGKVIKSSDDSRTIPVDSVWVRWFGGRPNEEIVAMNGLKTLSEGLETHHRAQKDARKGRKLNSQLEQAIQEAMLELDRTPVALSQVPSLKTANLSSTVLKTKTITIKASPISSSSSSSHGNNFTSSPTGSISGNLTSSLSTGSRSTKVSSPRGPKAKLVKIAPAPPSVSFSDFPTISTKCLKNGSDIVNQGQQKRS